VGGLAPSGGNFCRRRPNGSSDVVVGFRLGGTGGDALRAQLVLLPGMLVFIKKLEIIENWRIVIKSSRSLVMIS
jgi:hypothetical protein